MNAHARQRVDAYLTTNLGHFITMERTGTLDAYIEQCLRTERGIRLN